MKVGNNEVTDILIGETQVLKLYRGEDVIWERGGLPSGYTRVQCLEGTGTQYIDTGYKPNSNTKFEVEYMPTANYTGFMCIFGTQNSTSSQRFYGLISSVPYYLQLNFSNSSNPNVWGFNTDGTVVIGMNGTFTPYLLKVKLLIDNTSVKIETTNFNTTCSMLEFNTWGRNVGCDYNLTLFARNTAGVVSNNFSGELYSCKIYDNNTLVRDFVPCLDNNNRPCMYDLVTRQPFYNRGTGEFIYA